MAYQRKEIYPIEEVIKHVKIGRKPFHTFDGDEIKMDSQRYILFKNKGVTCVKCGLVGIFFAKERTIGQESQRFHFNLYGIKDGREVMITKDHIMPKSLGGKDIQSNYNVMCWDCNHEKQNIIETVPILSKKTVMDTFGECKYSCEITNSPGFFHTIVLKDLTIFISEWTDEDPTDMCAGTIIIDEFNRKSFANYTMEDLIKNIKNFVTQDASK